MILYTHLFLYLILQEICIQVGRETASFEKFGFMVRDREQHFV